MRRAAAIGAVLLLAAPAAAEEWVIDVSDSSVTFETQAFGRPVEGMFEEFGGEINLDPDDPSTAQIEAYVATGSVLTGTPEMETALTGPDGFQAQRHFRAIFNSSDIEEAETCAVAGARCYVATGTLTIRGAGRPLTLPFSLRREGDRAIADGMFEVRRTDYGIGTIEWGLSGRLATVHVHIEADARR